MDADRMPLLISPHWVKTYRRNLALNRFFLFAASKFELAITNWA